MAVDVPGSFEKVRFFFHLSKLSSLKKTHQAAVFPSLTASTVVSATPAKSPPHQIFGCEVRIVLGSTMGKLLSSRSIGDKASITD